MMTKPVPPLVNSVAPAAFGSAVPPGIVPPDQAAANAAMIAGMQRPQMGTGISLPYTAAQAVRPPGASPMPFTPAAVAGYQAAAAAQRIGLPLGSGNGPGHWNPGDTGFMGVPFDSQFTAAPKPGDSLAPAPALPPAVPAQPLDTASMERAVVKPLPPFVGPPTPMAPGYGQDWGPGTAFPLQSPSDRGPIDQNDWNWYSSHDKSLFDPFGMSGPPTTQSPLAAQVAMPSAPTAMGQPAVTGAGARPDYYSAFMQQESSGGKTAPDNPMQIQEGTFNRFAQQGESFSNPADRTTVAKRYVDYLGQKTNWDPQRMAVGYFSGEGNISPAGYANPWVKDTADSSGLHVSGYVPQFMQKLGQGGTAGGAPAGAAPMMANAAPMMPAGGMVAPGGYVMPRLANPGAAISTGMSQQLNYLRAAMQIAHESAMQGDPRNYSLRFAHAMGALGTNNFGQAQGQSADAFNQALVNAMGYNVNAGAQIYGHNTALAGNLYDVQHRTQPMGATLETAPNMPFPMLVPHEGLVEDTPQGPRAKLIAPQQGDASAAGKPSLEQFLAIARAKNPGVSDDALTQYYKKTYGG
jgi:hypothetical protein